MRTRAAPLRYGDLIQFSGVLRVPETVRNPGAFDWRGWLEQRGIHFTATIRKDDALDVAAHGQGNPVIAASLRLSRYLERSLRLGLEDEPKLAGALAGMVIGERSEIPTETYKDFQRTGVFHVFAINGLHVGLVDGNRADRACARRGFHDDGAQSLRCRCWSCTCSPRARIPARCGHSSWRARC